MCLFLQLPVLICFREGQIFTPSQNNSLFFPEQLLLGGTNTGKKKTKQNNYWIKKAEMVKTSLPLLYITLQARIKLKSSMEPIAGIWIQKLAIDHQTDFSLSAPNHIVPEKTKNKNRCSSTFTSNPRPSIFMALSYLWKCMHARVGGGGVADIDGEWKRA